jgi:uncharacterized membrane protein
MERPESLTPPSPLKGVAMKEREAVKLVIIFHAVGLAGFLVPALQPIFLKLVPWHLLFMFVLLVLSHHELNKKFIFFIILVYSLGYVAEWIGVHTNLLFGDYAYGKTLGFKISDVPLIIGVNWFLVSYAAGVTMQRLRLNIILRALLGGISLVLLDMLIEPVAIRFDYWHWADNIVPFKNYACWFGLSIVMLTIFELFRFQKQSRVTFVFLIVQFIFFAILHLSV